MIFSFVSRISLAFRFCILIRNEIIKFWPMTSLRTYDFPYFFVFFIILCFDGQPAWKLGVVTVAHDLCELRMWYHISVTKRPWPETWSMGGQGPGLRLGQVGYGAFMRCNSQYFLPNKAAHTTGNLPTLGAPRKR